MENNTFFISCFQCLLRAKEFIYEVQDKYYYIGAWVFRECTKQEIENYKIFLEELENMRKTLRDEHWENNPNTCEASEKLNEKFSKIKLHTKATMDREKERLIASNLNEFMSKLTNEDIMKIAKQREVIYEILDYIDGAFYRHDPKFKEDKTKWKRN